MQPCTNNAHFQTQSIVCMMIQDLELKFKSVLDSDGEVWKSHLKMFNHLIIQQPDRQLCSVIFKSVPNLSQNVVNHLCALVRLSQLPHHLYTM